MQTKALGQASYSEEGKIALEVEAMHLVKGVWMLCDVFTPRMSFFMRMTVMISMAGGGRVARIR